MSETISKKESCTMSDRPRIFVSHKVDDRKLVAYFKQQLMVLGLHSDEVYLSEETKPGTDWNDELKNAIKASDIMVFMYTDPSYDWDWCLFECGFFASLGAINGRERALVCINSGIGRPSPLSLWQDVSSEGNLEVFLTNIGDRIKSPLLGSKTGFQAFVQQFWTSIFRRLPLKSATVPEAFRQRRLTLIVPPEEMEKVRAGRDQDLKDELKVEISDGSRTIFPNAPSEAGWRQFLTAVQDQPLQRKWIDCIPPMIRMLNGTRTESPMLPLVRDGLNVDVAYRPSVAQRDLYGDHTVRYTVVFIRAPEATVSSRDRADRVYIWLMLARNFREAVLEYYQKKLRSVERVEDLRTWAEDLRGQVEFTRIDAFSRGMDMSADLELFCTVTVQTFGRLRTQWEEAERGIAEVQALAAQPAPPAGWLSRLRDQAKEALSQMLAVNAEFTLHIATAYLGYATQPRS